MKRRTLVQTCARWLIGPLVFVALMILGAILDDPQPIEQAAAIDLIDALQAGQHTSHRDAAAWAVCRSELGPGATVLWTREGDLVCRPSTLTAAKGGAL